MRDVLAIGEALIDMLDTGQMLYKANPGGAPCNFLASLAHFKRDVSFIGKLGNDDFGRYLIEVLNDHGIDTSRAILTDDHFTTLAFVTLDSDNDRHFSFARKPGADMMLMEEEVDIDFVKSHKIVYFGGVSLSKDPIRQTIKSTLSKIKGHCLIAYDPNVRLNLWASEKEAQEEMRAMMHYADIVKISNDEIAFLYPDLKAAINELSKKKIVFITLGKDGAICLYDKKVYPFKGYRVNVVDTTGAGDIFFGSAIDELLKYDLDHLSSEDIIKITNTATLNAARSCMYQGGITSVDHL